MKRSSALTPFRRSLDRWNRSFLLALKRREAVVKKLQKRKKGSTGPYPHYDPQREWELFTRFRPQLRALSLEELLAYSLIMESHATHGPASVYPRWSQGDHLRDKEKGPTVLPLASMINPLLLKAIQSPQLLKIDLLHDFEKILSLFSFDRL